ncbi:MAG: hypothetical protein LC708_01415, partial [Actinobacteria bacterium]|nr:hypothetical protein [Actinomycetota bacterium]
TITFTLFGPDDATCSGTPAFTSPPVPVVGAASYDSANFTPTAAGTYRWIAAYSGDANNAAATTACNDPNETVVVTAPPALTITTTASPGVLVGGFVHDTATLGGGTDPTGTITFTLFGPGDATCSGTPAFVSPPVPVVGAASYDSANFTPTIPGTYRWIAAYSGDANNAPATTACGDPAETVVVSAVVVDVLLTTTASPGVVLGGAVHDTATLGGTSPTGTITFTLFGPDDATCSGPPAFTSPAVPVTGNGSYESGDFTPTAAGTYRWVAAYSGDALNTARTMACNEPNETVVVTAAPPALTITTAASPGVVVGGAVHDTATLTGGVSPTGTIIFTLFGPDDATCSGTPAFTSPAVPVTAAGSYDSADFTPTAPGTYRWVAAYSGDANNAAVSTACG